MYGIEFEEAGNELICGQAVFTIKRRGKRDEKYKLLIHPDFGKKLFIKDDNHEFQEIFRGDEQVIKYLEKNFPTDFGFRWDWKTFVIALSFFGEGYDKGVNVMLQGEITKD